MSWFKLKLRKWLGVENHEKEIKKLEKEIEKLNCLYSDLVHIGIDVHFKEPHMILIYSKLNGGQIRHIPAQFTTLNELNSLVHRLKQMYRTSNVIWDVYPAIRRNNVRN